MLWSRSFSVSQSSIWKYFGYFCSHNVIVSLFVSVDWKYYLIKNFCWSWGLDIYSDIYSTLLVHLCSQYTVPAGSKEKQVPPFWVKIRTLHLCYKNLVNALIHCARTRDGIERMVYSYLFFMFFFPPNTWNAQTSW